MDRRVVFSVVLVFAACHRENKLGATPSGSTKVTTYEVHGVLREVSADGRKAVIAHETIPGYMEAMAMEFDVRDSALPNGLEPDDRVAFRLSVTDTKSWIDQLRRMDANAKSPRAERTPPTPVAAAAQPGTPLPDCALVDQSGRAFRLSDFKGDALAITFIFTRCPLPNFCPLMNRQFAEVQRALKGERASSNWHLLSLTLDPDYDTPERLAVYAAAYEPDPQRWTFATGNAEDIQKLGPAFGLATIRNGEQIDHNLRTVIVDASGRVKRVFAGNEWTPRELLDEMKRAMAAPP
jgi:protein SCO1